MNIRSGFLVALSSLLLSLVACTQAVTLDGGEAKDTVQRIQYAKEVRSGLCFAVVASITYANYKAISIAEVPCDRVEKFLAQ